MAVDGWLIVVGIGCGAFGFGIGKPVAVLAPLFGWPLFYVGLAEGWWLNGAGDGWQHVALMTTIVGTLCAAAGVALRTRSMRLVRAINR